MCILVDMSALSGHHALKARPEACTHVADVVLPHACPCAVNRGIQRVDVVVAGRADLALDLHPHAVIEGVQVR